jgi:hypothetical protein
MKRLCAALVVTLALGGCANTAPKPNPPKMTRAEEAREYARAARCHTDPTHCQELTEREDLEAEAQKR